MGVKVGDYVLIIEQWNVPTKPSNMANTPQFWQNGRIKVDKVKTKTGNKITLVKDKTNEFNDSTWKDKNNKSVKYLNDKIKAKLETKLRKLDDINTMICGPVLFKEILDIVNP